MINLNKKKISLLIFFSLLLIILFSSYNKITTFSIDKTFNNKYSYLANKYTTLFSKETDIKHIKIIKSYNREEKNFTQGLVHFGNTLIESTGIYTQSKINEYLINSTTLSLIKSIKLPDNLFAEGITLTRNNKLLLLSWKQNKGFIYKRSPKTYQWVKENEFNYSQSKEGWGLTSYIDMHGKTKNDKIFKSDGSSKIWILNTKTFEEEDCIIVRYKNTEIDNINELEYINGKIYANIWLTNYIIEINPNTGIVEKIIDASILESEIKKIQKIDHFNDVLNGIAYDKTNNVLYLTGKNWKKIFEVKIID